MQANPKISVTSKLDGIRSWSLEALDTCPGSIENGELVDACKGCYATTGNYRYPNVKAPRAHNRIDWENSDWTDSMVQALQNDRFFRWFDSGDMYSIGLAEKILEVCERTPWVKHWIPTRMAKFPKFADVIRRLNALPNVMVRFSSDSVSGEYVTGLHGSVIIPNAETEIIGAKVCEAYQHNGKCSGCRACYDKSVGLIAYPAHGKKMAKVIRMKSVA